VIFSSFLTLSFSYRIISEEASEYYNEISPPAKSYYIEERDTSSPPLPFDLSGISQPKQEILWVKTYINGGIVGTFYQLEFMLNNGEYYRFNDRFFDTNNSNWEQELIEVKDTADFIDKDTGDWKNEFWYLSNNIKYPEEPQYFSNEKDYRSNYKNEFYFNCENSLLLLWGEGSGGGGCVVDYTPRKILKNDTAEKYYQYTIELLQYNSTKE
jgi:hypothetical protein